MQQENEYYYVGRLGVKEYQDFLISTLRELGIEVPITDCNGFSAEVRRPSSMQTVNGRGARNVEELQKTQPAKPAVVSELYTDYMNCWGWPISSYPTTEMVYQQTMQTLAAGGMYSFFMMYGGTNFGFWASTTWKSDQSFITTRYYSRAPIAEGGALNETYFAVKAANVLSRNFEKLLTSGEACPLPARLSGPVNARAIKTSRGHLIFVEPIFPVDDSAVYRMDGRGPVITLEERWPMAELANQPGTLELQSEESIPLAEPSSDPSMLPFRLSIGPDCVVDYANATLLGSAGNTANRVLLIRGTAGRSGIVSINNKRLDFVFPATEPAQFTSGQLTVFALSQETADRTWFADDRVIIGPAFVGERRGHQHECYLDGSETTIYTISEQGEIERRSIAPKAISGAPQISLTNWTSFPMPEISPPRNGWYELEAPRGVEDLKAYWGYTWYRASYNARTPGKTGLFFTEAADRVHVFVNGKRMGVWGRGSGAVRDPLDVELAAGKNDFVFLWDNMGRLSERKCIDRKGIRGDVYVGAEARSLGEPEWTVPSTPPTNSWEYQTYAAFTKGSFLRAAWALETGGDGGLVLSIRSLPQYAWIAVDGKIVGEHAGDLSLAGGIDFSAFVLDEYLRRQPLRLEITFFGETTRVLNDHLRIILYSKAQRLGYWAFQTWEQSSSPGPVIPGDPACWECQFPRPTGNGPFFFVTQGLSKGQVYLNGHAVGRYWEIGPQHSLYLPEPWFADHNRLTIFDEEGKHPGQTYLMQDVRGAARMLLV